MPDDFAMIDTGLHVAVPLIGNARLRLGLTSSIGGFRHSDRLLEKLVVLALGQTRSVGTIIKPEVDQLDDFNLENGPDMVLAVGDTGPAACSPT